MPNWKKVIISGSDAALTSVTATAGFTGSLQGTASFAATAQTLLGSVTTAATSSKVISQGSTTGGTHYFLISNEDISSGPVAATVRTSNLTYNSATNTLPTTASWATNVVGGTGVSGTTNYIPKFTGTSAIGNSVIYDDGTNVGIGTTSPNSKLHVVGNTSITGSTNITGSLLVRNGLGTVLDTTNYNLVDGAVTSVAWGNRELKDTNNTATVDWEGLSLASPQGGGIDTVNWGTGALRSPANGPTSMSINWDDRIAYDENEFDSINWSGRVLFAGGNASVDWGSRLLNDSGAVNSIDWENRSAINSIGNTSIDWENSITYDGLGFMSIDYHGRRLYNAAGNALLSWTGTSATLSGTASWASNLVGGVGVTSVGGTGTVNGITLSGTVTSTGNLTLGGTLSNVQSNQLATSSLMIGTTNIALGATGSTLAGLTSVTSTGFTGSLSGTATSASVANLVNTVRTSAGDLYYPTFVDSANGSETPEKLYTADASNKLSYSAAAGALTALNFIGPLTGTASWATNVVNNGVTSVATAGTVSGITLTGGTITSTGTITLGGTLAVTPSNFSSQAANTFLAGPGGGGSAVPTFRAIVGADIPTLNQNTTGNATTATTAATASTISITATDGTPATFYPVFVDGQTGARIPRTDVSYTFNSQTNALTVSGGSISTTTVTATNINGTSSYALKGGSGYTIFGEMTTALANPVDATTYYGGHAANSTLSTTAGARKMYVPKTGFVRYAQIFVYNVAGTTELSTFWLVKNGATSSSIGTANHSATSILVSNYALNVSVAQGDYLEFKWVTPTWGTNPTSFTCTGHVLIEEV